MLAASALATRSAIPILMHVHALVQLHGFGGATMSPQDDTAATTGDATATAPDTAPDTATVTAVQEEGAVGAGDSNDGEVIHVDEPLVGSRPCSCHCTAMYAHTQCCCEQKQLRATKGIRWHPINRSGRVQF